MYIRYAYKYIYIYIYTCVYISIYQKPFRLARLPRLRAPSSRPAAGLRGRRTGPERAIGERWQPRSRGFLRKPPVDGFIPSPSNKEPAFDIFLSPKHRLAPNCLKEATSWNVEGHSISQCQRSTKQRSRVTLAKREPFRFGVDH